MGVDGVYARTALYEHIIERLGALVTRLREPGAEVFRFPPVMSRGQLERSGYLRQLSEPARLRLRLARDGSRDNQAAGRYEKGERLDDVAFACRPGSVSGGLLPDVPDRCPARGAVPDGGLLFDVAADCFRHEPSRDLDRLQSFRMREFVRIGKPAGHRRVQGALDGGAREDLPERSGLPHRMEQASDPFFGRVGQMKAVAQVQQALKFELLIPVRSEESPTACMSFNNHRDHFGTHLVT